MSTTTKDDPTTYATVPSDDDVDKLVQLRTARQREVELRSRRKRSREQGHAAVDELVEREAKHLARLTQAVVDEAAAPGGYVKVPTGIADAWALTHNPELVAHLHAAVDAEPLDPTGYRFATETDDEARCELADVRATIARLENEIEIEKAEGALAVAKARIGALRRKGKS